MGWKPMSAMRHPTRSSPNRYNRSVRRIPCFNPKATDHMALQREQVMAALRTVQDPELFKDIVTLGMVKDVQIEGSHVKVRVELTTPACPLKEKIEADVKA